MTGAEIARLVLQLYGIVTAWLAIAAMYSAMLVWHDRERRSTRLFVGLCIAAGWPLAPIVGLLILYEAWCQRRTRRTPKRITT